jgi:hypothetical protein
VIAKWIGKALQQLVPPHENDIHDIAPAMPMDINDPIAAADFKFKKIGRANGPKRFVVCPACNGGWMSTLENRAKPVMTPLILGTVVSKGTELTDASINTINTWMTKTTILLDCTEGTPPAIPQAVS